MKTVMSLYVVMRDSYGFAYPARIFDSRPGAEKFIESLETAGLDGIYRVDVVTAEFELEPEGKNAS